MTDRAPFLTDAQAVTAAIDARRPGLKSAKRNLLLFFAQGHHVAHFGTRLFGNSLLVNKDGRVSITGGAFGSEPIRDEGALNTIGYVVERYGALSPADLRALVRASDPGKEAAGAHPDGGFVRLDALRDWFRRDDETNDPDDERPNRAERAEADQRWAAHQAQQAS